VKVLQRHAVKAAGLLSLAAFPAVVAAQRGAQPGADTPRLLIATFRSAGDAALGVQSAEAIRTRVQQEIPVRQLWVLSRNDINNYLTSSGYKADSALSLTDLKELAKLMRADEILDGAATKTANGVRVDARLILSRDIALVQPLPAVEARTANDAAKQIEKSLAEARKSLADYRRCESALRDQKYDVAATAAREAIAKYPSSTLGRLCLMSAYHFGKQPPDSVIRSAVDALAQDSTSTMALGILATAYETKGDTAKQVETLIRLTKFDPSIRPRVLPILGRMGRPDIALPLVRQMLAESPGDPELLRMQWLLLLSGKQWKEALAAGEEYVKGDTAASTVDYFTRQISAATQDSQPQLASQIAARGVQKFPRDATLWAIYAQTLSRSGQLEQAITAMRRALEIDPKAEGGWPWVVYTLVQMNQTDSALAAAKQAVATGADKAALANVLQVPMGAAAKAAQDAAEGSNKRELWLAAYRRAAQVDSIAPTAMSKYFVGVSAFQVGLDALQGLNKSKSCSEVKLLEDMWAEAQINMPAGAAAGADQRAAATQVMGVIQQYSPNIAQAKKAFKCS
jgi:predicted Zn-dependent protease